MTSARQTCSLARTRIRLCVSLLSILYLSTVLCFSAEAVADTVLKENSSLKIIRLSSKTDARSIAEKYLNDANDAWQISDLNGRSRFKSGDIVTIPKKPINPNSVYKDHYRKIPILCYHQFTDGASKHQMQVSRLAFEQQMAYLADNGYLAIPLHKLREILLSEAAIPPKSVVITIDDGYRSVYDIAFPILKKYGFKATLFLYTDFIGGSAALSWPQIQEMYRSGLVDMQSHTKAHNDLSFDPNNENLDEHRQRIRQELDSAHSVIGRQLSISPTILAYPFGNSSDETIKHLKARQYELAVTVQRGSNSAFADPLLLNRTMIYGNHDLDNFISFLNTQSRYQ